MVGRKAISSSAQSDVKNKSPDYLVIYRNKGFGLKYIFHLEGRPTFFSDAENVIFLKKKNIVKASR